MIYQSALANDLPFYIPAYNSIPDMTFSLNNATRLSLARMSVIAGHFEWGVWNDLPDFSSEKRKIFSDFDYTTVSRIPSCFMMGRHPVDRVISYYYQRCYRESSCSYSGVLFGDLSREDMYHIIIEFRQVKYLDDGTTLMFSDDGVADSMCLAALGKRYTTGLLAEKVLEETGGSLPKELSLEDHQHAISNSNQCVIGMLEEWEMSFRMLKYWFPWMSIPVQENNKKSTVDTPHLMKLYKNKENVKTLHPDIREYIESLIPCDMKLYRSMLNRFEKQKSYLITKQAI